MYDAESNSAHRVATPDGPSTDTAPRLFQECADAIDHAYVRLGHTLGWRFLSCPRATLSPTTEVGLVSLNPGGTFEPQEHPRASSEAGSAYLIESWPGCGPGAAPLQRQIQALFRALARHLGRENAVDRFMNEQVLSAHFIPFRSPRFADLPRRPESIAFAKELWNAILSHWKPRVLITIDTEAFASLEALLLGQCGNQLLESRRFDTGWGNYQAAAIRIARPEDDSRVTLARLPHLSTFKLFSRDACRPYLEDFLGYVADKSQ